MLNLNWNWNDNPFSRKKFITIALRYEQFITFNNL